MRLLPTCIDSSHVIVKQVIGKHNPDSIYALCMYYLPNFVYFIKQNINNELIAFKQKLNE